MSDKPENTVFFQTIDLEPNPSCSSPEPSESSSGGC